MRTLTVLGVETSCDETAAAVVRWPEGGEGPAEVLSSVVASQVAAHRPYGGVVPEVAARAHVEIIDDIIAQAMRDACLGFGQLDGVAATAGPGLVGGVMVGLSAGKAIAIARGLPLIAVNHLEGHAVSARLAARAPYPFLLLLVSGGHCQLLAMEGIGRSRRLGTTLDDAAGEAFDKIAASLGLPYPGGPALEALAKAGRPGRFTLPRMLLGRTGCDFSFSGLKTAAARLAETIGDEAERADLALAVQSAIADQLADRSARAMTDYLLERGRKGRLFVVAGGVAANAAVRARLETTAAGHSFAFAAPPLAYCTDNAAMIALAGAERLALGLTDGWDAPARPRWPLDAEAARAQSHPRSRTQGSEGVKGLALFSSPAQRGTWCGADTRRDRGGVAAAAAPGLKRQRRLRPPHQASPGPPPPATQGERRSPVAPPMSKDMRNFGTLGVIGAGAWGTALAQVGARAGLQVRLWAHEAEVANAMATTRENTAYLPGVRLENAVSPTSTPADLADVNLVLAACPAQHMRATLAAFAPHLAPTSPIVLCAKGVEQGSLRLMSEVAAEVLPASPIAVLSGPSFAAEVARGLPCAVTLACADVALGEAIARALALPSFRPYVAGDVVGAEAGGAVKNVLAIACGVVEGRGLGRSAHAGLITRGFAEMTRLGVALGGRAETLAGLCGLGDLVLTCSSPLSRNMSLGIALGRGETLEAALAGKRSIAEGLASAPAVLALANRLGVEAPICEAVAQVLGGETGVDAAIDRLLSRPLRLETPTSKETIA